MGAQIVLRHRIICFPLLFSSLADARISPGLLLMIARTKHIPGSYNKRRFVLVIAAQTKLFHFMKGSAMNSYLNAYEPYPPGSEPILPTSTGSLIILVRSEAGQPLAGVHVYIYRAYDDQMIYNKVTDAGGIVGPLTILEPGIDQQSLYAIVPYSLHHIDLNLPGYKTTKYKNLPVYTDSITTLTCVLIAP